MDARQFDDMPEELRGCCALALDISSAGCFGQVDKACKELVEGRLASEKAAHEAPYVEFSSRHGQALAAMCRIPDGPKLIKFSDGGAQVFTCSFVHARPGVHGRARLLQPGAPPWDAPALDSSA